MSFEFAKKLYSEKKYKKAIEQYQIAITEVDFSDEYFVDFIKTKNKMQVTPLLIEGQLRRFIEDKIEFPIVKIELINRQYNIYTKYKAIDNYSDIWLCDKLGEDLLQAYWKVACMIAKEEVDDEN